MLQIRKESASANSEDSFSSVLSQREQRFLDRHSKWGGGGVCGPTPSASF